MQQKLILKAKEKFFGQNRIFGQKNFWYHIRSSRKFHLNSGKLLCSVVEKYGKFFFALKFNNLPFLFPLKYHSCTKIHLHRPIITVTFHQNLNFYLKTSIISQERVLLVNEISWKFVQKLLGGHKAWAICKVWNS